MLELVSWQQSSNNHNHHSSHDPWQPPGSTTITTCKTIDHLTEGSAVVMVFRLIARVLELVSILNVKEVKMFII